MRCFDVPSLPQQSVTCVLPSRCFWVPSWPSCQPARALCGQWGCPGCQGGSRGSPREELPAEQPFPFLLCCREGRRGKECPAWGVGAASPAHSVCAGTAKALGLLLLILSWCHLDVPGAAHRAQSPGEGQQEGVELGMPSLSPTARADVEGGIGRVGSGLAFPRDELIQLQSVFLKSLPEYLAIIWFLRSGAVC